MWADKDPRYTMPSRKYLSKTVIPDKYEKAKDNLSRELNAAKSLAFTTDSWTSRATNSYVTMPVHIPTKDWTQRCYILDTVEYNDSYTADNLVELKRYQEKDATPGEGCAISGILSIPLGQHY